MYLFCFQPEIPFVSTFSLHSSLSAYQGLLLKAEGELFFPALSKKKSQNCGLLFVELGGQTERFGEGLNLSPPSLPCCLQFVQVNYDGMDRNHITSQMHFVLQAGTLFSLCSVVTFSVRPPPGSTSPFPVFCSSFICSTFLILTYYTVCLSWFLFVYPYWNENSARARYLSLLTSVFPVLRMASGT